MEVTNYFYYFLGALAFAVSAVLWVTNQLTKLREYIGKQFDKVLDKLEYHERHDDERFARIANQLMEVRLANARYGLNGSRKKTESGITEGP